MMSEKTGENEMYAIKNQDDEFLSLDSEGNEIWTDDCEDGTAIEFWDRVDALKAIRKLYVPFATQIVKCS